MSHKNPEISVLVPVYNSAQTLTELVERLDKVLERLVGANYEIIFANDGSSDSSWEILKKIAHTYDKTIAVNLTCNFGQHNTLMCLFSQSSGRYVITIDDDLQIPPEEIPKLYNEIHEGFDVVYGVYGNKRHSLFRNIGSELVQWVYRKTFDVSLQFTSFRIIHQNIVQHLLAYEKSFTFIDGLICWFTKRIGNVQVTHYERKTGKSGYSLKTLITLALNMVTNFSIIPVQVASLIGMLFSFVGFAFGIYFLLKKIFWGIPVSGFASTIVAITVFSGVQLLTMGILGEYTSRIHINVSKRPQYAIREIVRGNSANCFSEKIF